MDTRTPSRKHSKIRVYICFVVVSFASKMTSSGYTGFPDLQVLLQAVLFTNNLKYNIHNARMANVTRI